MLVLFAPFDNFRTQLIICSFDRVSENIHCNLQRDCRQATGYILDLPEVSSDHVQVRLCGGEQLGQEHLGRQLCAGYSSHDDYSTAALNKKAAWPVSTTVI